MKKFKYQPNSQNLPIHLEKVVQEFYRENYKTSLKAKKD